ncbi:GntR family transcriptional regulator [Bradyrhizobium erythrophlei]|jgi:GntR family transcriptional regulator|uniref:Transcriptional regulator, GntR family n=1 Tax=Bradyrhizobium erythrophlei TaxID=1437360 RepID=A0A1M5L4R9_9BRAD|nr:GntR family transcriptional regulator [Bradyrhizobium erythrophlei]SHG60082.1 transcriptional regulator, GntR family [Bradyrhizobium erythrophlei]
MEIESIPPVHESFELERGNPRALHEQLSDRLKSEFLSTYSSGQQIPTEEAICQSYGLSRVTVRRAIQTLVERGLLIRRQGKGTFLARPKPRITYEIDRLGPFMDAFASSSEPVSASLVDFKWATGKQVPKCFSTSSSVLVYERIYQTAGTPHGFLQITMPAFLGERVGRADAAENGVYQILREKLGIEPFRASFNISTELPDAALAAHLVVSPTTPLLSLERISYDAQDVAIERTMHHLLPEVYQLSVNVHARIPRT